MQHMCSACVPEGFCREYSCINRVRSKCAQIRSQEVYKSSGGSSGNGTFLDLTLAPKFVYQ